MVCRNTRKYERKIQNITFPCLLQGFGVDFSWTIFLWKLIFWILLFYDITGAFEKKIQSAFS